MIYQSSFGQDPNDLYALVNSQDPRVTPVMKAQAMRALHAAKQSPSIAQGAQAAAPIVQRPAPQPAPQVNEPKQDLSPAEMIDHGDDTESPLDMGAKRAEAAWAERTKPNADSKDLMGMQPSFMDAVKKYMATGDDDATSPEDDKRMAFMQAGAGMAASNSPYLGQAIGQGAMIGLQSLQKMRQQRAEEAMKKATLGFNMGREEENRTFQNEQLKIANRRADMQDQALRIQQAKADLAAGKEHWIPGGIDGEGHVVLINSETGESKTTDFNAKGTVAPLPDLPPDELRKVIPKAELAVADAILDGRSKAPSPANRSASAQRTLQLVNALDPTFDVTDTETRFNTARDFASSGTSGKAVTSANTLVGHLGSLDKHIDALGNTDWATSGNSIKNYLAEKTGKMSPETTAAVGKYKMDVEVVSKELVKLLRNSGGTGEEVKGITELLDNAKTPTELHAAVQEAVELMDSRVGALASAKSKGMGKSYTAWDLFDEGPKKVLARLSPEYAKQYMGGGGGDSSYKSPDDVKAAVKSGSITKADGHKILVDQFGFE